jgi:transcriptional regulator with XRE-family HTH domain
MDTKALAAEIAARLRAERARLNLTLKDAGKLSGVHFVSISRYEQGNRVPTVESLYLLAEAYGVTVGSLLPDAAPRTRKRGGKSA